MDLEKLGPFSPCSIKIIDGKISPADKDDIYTCCKNRCYIYNKKCNVYCEKNYPEYIENIYPSIKENISECKQSCKIMENVCNKLCESSRFDYEHRYFDDCLEKNDCIDNTTINNNCMENNKKKIIDCCLEKCKDFNEKDINCDKHCENSWNINYSRSMNKFMDNNISVLKKKEKNPKIIIWTFITILIVIYIYKIYSR